jgi:type VI protein secretion system component Hcp
MSWLNRLFGRSSPQAAEPAPALSAEGNDPAPGVEVFMKFSDIKGESKYGPEEPPGDLAAADDSTVPAGATFAKFGDIKGESDDTDHKVALESFQAPADEPVGAGYVGMNLAGVKGDGGTESEELPTESVSINYAKMWGTGAGANETETVGGLRTEDIGAVEAGIPGLHKAGDVTLKRGTFGPDDDGGFNVKLEEVVPADGGAPRTSSGPEESGEGAQGVEIDAGDIRPTETLTLNFSKVPSPPAPPSPDPQGGGEVPPGAFQSGDQQTEEMALNFQKIEFQHLDAGDSKSAGDDVERGWNVAGREGGTEAPHKGEIELSSWSMSPPAAAQPLGDTTVHEGGHWMGDEPPPDSPGALAGAGPANSDAPHKEELEVESFSWGASPAPAAEGDGGAADALARKAGEGQQDYLEVKMQDVLVSSYQTSGSGAGAGEKGGTEDINIGVGELQESAAEPGFIGGVRVAAGDTEAFAKSSPVLSDIVVTKETDKASAMSDEDDDDTGALASLEVQEPGAVGVSLQRAADAPDLGDTDLDVDDLDVEL